MVGKRETAESDGPGEDRKPHLVGRDVRSDGWSGWVFDEIDPAVLGAEGRAAEAG
jgi:hypothetical protein